MVPDIDKNSGGPSVETVQRVSAYPAVEYLLAAIPGSPEQRAQGVAKVIQELFPENGVSTDAARSALKSFCATHKLNVYDYLKSTPMKVNVPISVTS